MRPGRNPLRENHMLATSTLWGDPDVQSRNVRQSCPPCASRHAGGIQQESIHETSTRPDTPPSRPFFVSFLCVSFSRPPSATKDTQRTPPSSGAARLPLAEAPQHTPRAQLRRDRIGSVATVCRSPPPHRRGGSPPTTTRLDGLSLFCFPPLLSSRENKQRKQTNNNPRAAVASPTTTQHPVPTHHKHSAPSRDGVRSFVHHSRITWQASAALALFLLFLFTFSSSGCSLCVNLCPQCAHSMRTRRQ
mmetsp:Transcript_47940/g.147934  ORF Transcript_47940/g.147934 Transcript_47940/m.147934 type:complete len:247 (-) Transcript_47940:109-849(-)